MKSYLLFLYLVLTIGHPFSRGTTEMVSITPSSYIRGEHFVRPLSDNTATKRSGIPGIQIMWPSLPHITACCPFPVPLCLLLPDHRLHSLCNAFRPVSGLHTVIVFDLCLKLFVFIYKLLYSGRKCAVFADLSVIVLLQTDKSGFQFKIATVDRAQNLDDFLK